MRAVGEGQRHGRLGDDVRLPLGRHHGLIKAPRRVRVGVIPGEDEEARDGVLCVLQGLPRDGEQAVPVECAGVQHRRQLQPRGADLAALRHDELVVLGDGGESRLLLRPEREGDEGAGLLLDDEAGGDEVDERWGLEPLAPLQLGEDAG